MRAKRPLSSQNAEANECLAGGAAGENDRLQVSYLRPTKMPVEFAHSENYRALVR